MKKVVFLTDPEGNLGYFEQCINQSNGAYYDPSGELKLRPEWTFVFGGDLCDKAPGSLRIAKQLVSVKKRYPDRVYLIVGNRDLNKLRFLTELTDEALAVEPPIPYGSPKSCTTYSAFLAKLALEAKHKSVSEGAALPAEVWSELNSRANRLRWILDCTMGSQGDFERRRSELAALARNEPSAISDEEVVKSYVESVRDGGVMRDFLSLGVLAVGIDSTLYVHGGLISMAYSKAGDKFNIAATDTYTGDVVNDGAFEVALGCVPGQAARETDVNAWIDKLNAWLQAVVNASIASPPKQPLAAFGQQYCAYGTWPSVITSRHLNEKSQPAPMPVGVSQQLLKSGYSRLVIGHTPHGNCPTVVPGPVQVIMADTSYSDMKTPDNRGEAASIVEVEGARACVTGRLEDKRPIAYTVYSGQSGPHPDEDTLIGRGDFANWFVKAKIAGTQSAEPQYMLCHVEGFKYEYKTLSEVETKKEIGV